MYTFFFFFCKDTISTKCIVPKKPAAFYYLQTILIIDYPIETSNCSENCSIQQCGVNILLYNAAFQNINENQYRNCLVQNCMKKVTDCRQTFPIKFMFSSTATKNYKIFTVDLTLTTVVCIKVHKIVSVWCKIALGEVGVSLP